MTSTAVDADLSEAADKELEEESISSTYIRQKQNRGLFAVLALLVLLIVTVLLNAGLGAVEIAPLQVMAILLNPLLKMFGLALPYEYTDPQSAVFWAIRFPRIIFAGLIGATLATSGAAIQGIFRNPLADPGLIGISSGASLAAAAAFVVGESWFSVNEKILMFMVPLVAFAGALLAMYVVLNLSRVGKRVVVTTMLLVGIAVNALCGAGIGVFTYFADDSQLRSITFWSLGNLGGATWSIIALTAPLMLGSILILPRFSRSLNLLLLGESEASHLGVNTDLLKKVISVIVALAVGVAVSFAGLIGFVGLVVPHILRLALGPDHRYVLSLAPLAGAVLLLGSDLAARIMVSPAELPIGIVTSALGAPFFLWLVVRQRSVESKL